LDPIAATHGDSDAERNVLDNESGRALLSEVASVLTPQASDLTRWRRSYSAEIVSAAIRLAKCRRKARLKFSRGELMWLDPVGLEQSTAEPVARRKADRFVDAPVVDLCCGIGGDSLALAARARSVVAVDSDIGMCRRTRWNAGIYDVDDRVLAVSAYAERAPISDRTLVHIDPDRRRGGRKRARLIEAFTPGLETLRELMRTARGGAIKLGPASDFETHFRDTSLEIELISLRGECKEATVWFGDRTSCSRRATVLPENQTWTDRDEPTGLNISVAGLSDWVFDPDPALSRSGLLAGFAAAHGIGRLAPSVDYLSGPRPIDTPFLAAFGVRDVLPFDLKRLHRYITNHGLGPLEIKIRGVDARPETIRAQLRSPGPNAVTLLIYPATEGTRVVIAQRRRPIDATEVE
jgi:THUMP domain-like/RNA cap guanine-N2 methyltransferase